MHSKRQTERFKRTLRSLNTHQRQQWNLITRFCPFDLEMRQFKTSTSVGLRQHKREIVIPFMHNLILGTFREISLNFHVPKIEQI